ncbi:MAG TPA: response regulator transcription factor [Gemmatales bacterium]|nr:response regulator transcription factor [Gemmatales bacterium]
MRPHLVVAEDDPAIRRGVVDVLTAAGYDVGAAADGAAGLEIARRPGVALVLLDLLMPKMDGLQVLAELRQEIPSLPVIILTARGSEEDRVRGLQLGADDYVVKPFSARELLARVQAVLRRCLGQSQAIRQARWGSLLVDFQRREVRRSRKEREELSEMEAAVLEYLLSQRDRAVSRPELLSRLWGAHVSDAETRTVDMHVARLRQKLQASDAKNGQEPIVTVRAQGYMAGPLWVVNPDSEEQP